MLICILDGNNIKNKETLHNTLADALQLPDWYGRNLDALYDCLSDIQDETEIRILHEGALDNHLGHYADAFRKAVYRACQDNSRIHFIKTSGKEAMKMDLNHITINTQNSIRIEGSRILYFDPFQVEDSRYDADIIFITHDHYDHFEPDSIAKIKKDGTLIIAPESMKKKVLSESGIKSDKCVFYRPEETHEQDNLIIQTVPAYNKLKPFHPKMKKWQGYTVKMDDIRYYVAGDTDVNEDIKKVQCDVALIPIGGFYTMDKKQAAEYISEIKPRAVIPTHYGSIIGQITDGQDFESYLKTMDESIQVELKLY